MDKFYANTNIVDVTKPMTYSYCLATIRKLNDTYPDLISTSNAGFSRFKRLLPYMRVGLGKHEIFICGAHHGREYISTSYLLKIVEEYLFCYKNTIMFEGYCY